MSSVTRNRASAVGVARMAEQQQRARTDEERHYYALNAKAWRLLAPFYDPIVFPLKRLRRVVARLAGVGPGSRVLDVATGTGAQALAFAETGAEVVGIDLSEFMLRIACRKAHGRNVSIERDSPQGPKHEWCLEPRCGGGVP
jgi:2-polyprenyl-3-methyl-5-hydroxy-6-metoxy-1,4-benzoquinol methylase